jgi:hypothetical protein
MSDEYREIGPEMREFLGRLANLERMAAEVIAEMSVRMDTQHQQRHLHIGRTQIEAGLMFLQKAVWEPEHGLGVVPMV